MGDFRLDGKRALVTGATSGIGEEIASEFSRAGARLVVTGRNRVRADRLGERLAAAGADVHVVIGDLALPEFADTLLEKAVRESGPVDIVVNAAGVFHQASLAETDDSLWRDVMAINVDAVFRVCRAAVRHMRSRGGGVIVNVAGDWGLISAERVFAYCVSKAAVVQMARSIAVDYARDGIRINTLCPGDVDTPMLDGLAAGQGLTSTALRERSRSRTPNRRLATVQDIATAARFLASDEAAHIHAVALPVEGGGLAL